MRSWDRIPHPINNELVKPYYDILKRKWFYRFVKRLFDLTSSFIMFFLLLFPSIIIGILIVCTSKGGMFFCQLRIGRYGKPFKIIKFRTMRKNSEGDKHITSKNDDRITNIGKFLRKTHLDELPQLLNVFIGQMSFVGTRPEVIQFVSKYSDEWYATLLMRPGITSTASYSFYDESSFIDDSNYLSSYLKDILPAKMKINLSDLGHPFFKNDLIILWRTVF